MRKLFATLALYCFGLAMQAAPVPPKAFDFQGDVVYQFERGARTAVATNGIVIHYGEVTMTAREARVDLESGEAVAEGDVRVEHEKQTWISDRMEYNFKTGHLAGESYKAGQAPYFVRGDLLLGDQKAGVYLAQNGDVTTDDYADPGYHIHAKQLVVVPGEYIEARDAVLYIKNVPAFYYPYFRRSLKTHPNNWVFVPGYRSLYGPFLLTSYNWYWNDQLDGTLHMDYREKRGFGVGPDVNYKLPSNFGEGGVKYYYTYDKEPGVDLEGEPIDSNRQRLWFEHKATLASNLTAKVAARYQSDPFVIRDFFESEYRKNVEPASYAEVNKLWSNYSLDALAVVQLNQFFETVERLPEVKFAGMRDQIGNSPFFYETDSSIGYYQRQNPAPGTNDFGGNRFDTFHQVSLPKTFFGWLNVTPRVGGRYTHYGATTGDAAGTTEEDRGIFNAGAEITTKASALWPGIKSRFWDIDGLRHVLEPSINYTYVPTPNVLPSSIPQYDYLLPTTDLLPIEFPQFNSIDSINAQNVMRFGLRNRLQTKRKSGVDNVLYWSLFGDWRLQPIGNETTFSDIYSDMDVKPFSWMVLNSQLRYSVDRKEWDEANHFLTLTPGSRWSFSVGHRYLRNFAGSTASTTSTNTGSDVVFGSIFYRFNENWGARAGQYYDLQNSFMQEQVYSIYRDLRSWTAALSFRVRRSTQNPVDYTVAITASLKAFPRFKIGQDATQPATMFGY